jgi:hypothetical protein
MVVSESVGKEEYRLLSDIVEEEPRLNERSTRCVHAYLTAHEQVYPDPPITAQALAKATGMYICVFE